MKLGEELAWHVDDQVEDVHFRRGWGRLEDVGFRAASAALSDLAAVGARPLGVQLALEIPRDTSDREVLAVVRGFASSLARARVPLVGGNIAGRPSASGLSLSVSVAGAVSRGRAFRRDGARPGDGLYVSGIPGLAAAGLAILERGARPRTRPARAALDRFLRPEPRLALGRALARLAPAARPRAATDTSDGLAVDAGKLARASGLAATIREALVPLEPVVAATRGLQEVTPLDLAVAGGEDYELLVAAPEAFERTAIARRSFRLVGRFERGEPGRVVLERRGGERVRLGEVGFDHRRMERARP